MLAGVHMLSRTGWQEGMINSWARVGKALDVIEGQVERERERIRSGGHGG